MLPSEQALWSDRLSALLEPDDGSDPAHDAGHVSRVVRSALELAEACGADLAVVLPAAWLHDVVRVPKSSPQRAQASRLAADRAIELLIEQGYPAIHHPAIHHAIVAHSFSAGIPPDTLEAKVVQDADRLDAIGAIGLMRCFALGGAMGRELYAVEDPFYQQREPNDRRYNLDHLPAKLLTLASTMQTEPGRREAQRRTAFLHQFLDQLRSELM